LSKRTLWAGGVAVLIVLGFGAVWVIGRGSDTTTSESSPESSTVASSGTSEPPTSPVPSVSAVSIPGLEVDKVTKVWSVRWKTSPTTVASGGKPVQEHVTAPFPGDGKATLSLWVMRVPNAPDQVWDIACHREQNGGAPSTDRTPAQLADYCLRAAVSDAVYRDVAAWAKPVGIKHVPVRKRFSGYVGVIDNRPGDTTSLFVVAGTKFPGEYGW
jgi:hypothetical protein